MGGEAWGRGERGGGVEEEGGGGVQRTSPAGALKERFLESKFSAGGSGRKVELGRVG